MKRFELRWKKTILKRAKNVKTSEKKSKKKRENVRKCKAIVYNTVMESQ